MAERNDKTELGSGRVEAFSDAVFAVIITIMALELRAPQGHTLADVRDDLLPGLIVYALSFTLIGIYWNNHHHLLRAAERVNGAVMWTNLFLLFWLSLVPVLTEWLRDEYQEPLPAAAYGVVLLAAGLAYSLLVHALSEPTDGIPPSPARSARTSRGTSRSPSTRRPSRSRS